MRGRLSPAKLVPARPSVGHYAPGLFGVTGELGRRSVGRGDDSLGRRSPRKNTHGAPRRVANIASRGAANAGSVGVHQFAGRIPMSASSPVPPGLPSAPMEYNA